ncbi:MAG: PAS domain S-box protein [Rhodopseudomonas sp.]|uniref:sensor protein FixL n=1 Tax=Rhodopseudomonas sp. TaxID=1078 RepID=UPI00185B9501|nr:sensor protein FixL [Rhodopseudomonas sp.]NVN87993.1 PAS domain S-box protein [Rhodopseudomonas sp.]
MSGTVQSSSDASTREQRLQQGIDRSGVGSWELNLSTQELVCSASARNLFGLSSELSANYELFLSLVDAEDRDRVAREVKQAIESEQSFDMQFRVGDQTRPSRWLRIRGGVVRLEPGTRGYLCGIVFNIDEQIELESELRMQQGQLRSILDTVPDAMILIDGHGIMRFFSSAAERMFGFSEGEAIGRNVRELMPPTDAARHDGHLDRYRSTGERHIIGIGRIVTGQRRDGTTFPIHLSIGEMLSGGKPYFTGFIRDLTEYQQTQARLHELQSELVHVSRLSAMGEMASALAHELNQPLSAISNYMKGSRRLLAGSRDPNTTKIETAMDRAAEQALRAGQIIRRLRDFVSRGESEKRVESLAKLIEEAGALGLTGAREQGVLLRFNLDPANDLVLVDRVQIQQVLVNLFRNALEAMAQSPKKELSASNVRIADDMIEVAVSDSGSGIHDDVKSSLFQTFFTTKETGMGVGLSISRSIIEAHGGRMWAESNSAGGATFRFTLPVAASEDLTDAS